MLLIVYQSPLPFGSHGFADHLFAIQPASVPAIHFTVPLSFSFLFFDVIGTISAERRESSHNGNRILAQL